MYVWLLLATVKLNLVSLKLSHDHNSISLNHSEGLHWIGIEMKD